MTSDVYDVVVPVERETIVDADVRPGEGTKTEAKLRGKETVELAEDEHLRGAGRAIDQGAYYSVVVKVGRELSTTVEAAHPQEARRKAKSDVETKPGEQIVARPQVSLSPGDPHVE